MRRILSALCLSSTLLAAGCLCSPASSALGTDPGQHRQLSEDGAFMVTLTEDGTLGKGINRLSLRVGTPDEYADTDGGYGVPGVDVVARVSMADRDVTSPPPMIREVGEGEYDIEGVLISGEGRWSVAVELTSGDARDQAEFDLEI